MDQKIRLYGGLLVALLLIFCAFILLTIGIGMLASYPDENWWIGLLLTYCWNTRKGQIFDEIRVPIPKGCLKEAIFLEERLMK